ncbi:hypothetical protein CC80DRAFT_506084 [Byssothecium circinans]|uniref:Uncharacterized protein n=1 Tax=Byssothecium circinans TaxID=147558 RepID=A0A6A5TT53_9PLEO|nr:hypothetical protein CC80DRAFT_506084 [Byssothecium circinans]
MSHATTRTKNKYYPRHTSLPVLPSCTSTSTTTQHRKRPRDSSAPIEPQFASYSICSSPAATTVPLREHSRAIGLSTQHLSTTSLANPTKMARNPSPDSALGHPMQRVSVPAWIAPSTGRANENDDDIGLALNVDDTKDSTGKFIISHFTIDAANSIDRPSIFEETTEDTYLSVISKNSNETSAAEAEGDSIAKAARPLPPKDKGGMYLYPWRTPIESLTLNPTTDIYEGYIKYIHWSRFDGMTRSVAAKMFDDAGYETQESRKNQKRLAESSQQNRGRIQRRWLRTWYIRESVLLPWEFLTKTEREDLEKEGVTADDRPFIHPEQHRDMRSSTANLPVRVEKKAKHIREKPASEYPSPEKPLIHALEHYTLRKNMPSKGKGGDFAMALSNLIGAVSDPLTIEFTDTDEVSRRSLTVSKAAVVKHCTIAAEPGNIVDNKLVIGGFLPFRLAKACFDALMPDALPYFPEYQFDFSKDELVGMVREGHSVLFDHEGKVVKTNWNITAAFDVYYVAMVLGCDRLKDMAVDRIHWLFIDARKTCARSNGTLRLLDTFPIHDIDSEFLNSLSQEHDKGIIKLYTDLVQEGMSDELNINPFKFANPAFKEVHRRRWENSAIETKVQQNFCASYHRHDVGECHKVQEGAFNYEARLGGSYEDLQERVQLQHQATLQHIGHNEGSKGFLKFNCDKQIFLLKIEEQILRASIKIEKLEVALQINRRNSENVTNVQLESTAVAKQRARLHHLYLTVDGATNSDSMPSEATLVALCPQVSLSAHGNV